MWDEQVQEACRKLKPFIGDESDRLWRGYATAMRPEDKRFFEAAIQNYVSQFLQHSVADTPILLPPPQPHQCGGDFLLGKIAYGTRRLHSLYLRREDIMKHCTICATIGGGKTNVAQLITVQLLNAGVPFLVVDWKRSYRDLLSIPSDRIGDLRIYTIGRKTKAPLNWNPLRPPPGVHIQTWISVVAEVLERSHISGMGSGDVLMQALDDAFEREGFYEDKAEKYPNFHDLLLLVAKMDDRGRAGLWKQSALRIIRTFTFGPAAGGFNARHPIAFETLLDCPVILEIDQELPKPLRVFMSEITLRWIHLYRLSQGETNNELRHVTILEEAHNLFPKNTVEKQSQGGLETVFRELRGFGEGIVAITQHPSLMPVYVLGNSNSQVYLPLQHEDDIVSAKRSLFLKPGEEVYLDKLKVGQGIVKIKGRCEACLVEFPLVPIRKGSITDDMLPAVPGGDDGTAKMDSVGDH